MNSNKKSIEQIRQKPDRNRNTVCQRDFYVLSKSWAAFRLTDHIDHTPCASNLKSQQFSRGNATGRRGDTPEYKTAHLPATDFVSIT